MVVGIAEQGLLRGSLAVYAMPLLGLFAGALAGRFFGTSVFALQSDGLSIAGAGIGFAAALFWLRRFSRRKQQDASYQPVALRRHISTG